MKLNRTIQHPGFEFKETSIYSSNLYTGALDTALVIGYAPKGPINAPTFVRNISEFTTLFGLPTNEQETYFYTTAKNIFAASGRITAIRLPYDNSISPLQVPSLDNNYKNCEISYRGVKFTVEREKGSSNHFLDIKAGFNNRTLNNINLVSEPVFITDDELRMFNEENSFIISNKNNLIEESDGTTYFIKVNGVGNAIREQGYASGYENDIVNPYLIDDNGNSVFYTEDDKKLTAGREKSDWPANNYLTSTDQSTEIDTLISNNNNLIPNVDTKEYYIQNGDIGLPQQNYLLETPNKPVMEVGETIDLGQATISISYGTYNASGTNTTDDKAANPQKYPATRTAYAEIEVAYVTDPEPFINIDHNLWEMECEYYLNIYSDATKTKLIETYTCNRITSETVNYKWEVVIPGQADKNSTEILVDANDTDYITVTLFKVSPSKTDLGKFVISPVESYTGSIIKGSIDSFTKETTYIGDIINNTSTILNFAGTDTYTQFDKKEDFFLVKDSVPYVIALVDNSERTLTSDNRITLKPIICRADFINSFDYANIIIAPALSKVRNNIQYGYRDIYDGGVSSVGIYLTTNMPGNAAGDYYYRPILNNTTTITPLTIQANAWKHIVKIFARHCKVDHKLSMFHADGPRLLVLNGDRPRADVYTSNMENIFTKQIIQSLSIRDSSYTETNVQWYNTYSEELQRNIWLPTSVFMANILTRNDISFNIWNAPAGIRYGRLTGINKIAFNPTNEIMDLLYLNNFNYGVAWPDGNISIEGQKTNVIENTALNRINVRRLMIWLERFTQNVCTRYRYEQNTEALRTLLVNNLDTEYKRIYGLGGTYGYRIVADEENNTPEVIDNNEMRLTIMIQPSRTLEYIVANFIVTSAGINLEDYVVGGQ